MSRRQHTPVLDDRQALFDLVFTALLMGLAVAAPALAGSEAAVVGQVTAWLRKAGSWPLLGVMIGNAAVPAFFFGIVLPGAGFRIRTGWRQKTAFVLTLAPVLLLGVLGNVEILVARGSGGGLVLLVSLVTGLALGIFCGAALSGRWPEPLQALGAAWMCLPLFLIFWHLQFAAVGLCLMAPDGTLRVHPILFFLHTVTLSGVLFFRPALLLHRRAPPLNTVLAGLVLAFYLFRAGVLAAATPL